MPVMTELRDDAVEDTKNGAETRVIDEVNEHRNEKQNRAGDSEKFDKTDDHLPRLDVIEKPEAEKPKFQMEKVTKASKDLKSDRVKLSDSDIFEFRVANIALGTVDTALCASTTGMTILFGSVAIADPEPSSKLLCAAATPFAAGAALASGWAAIGRFSWAFASKESIENELNKSLRR